MRSYSEYFKMKDAYNFLIREGYSKEVDCIKMVGYNTNTARLVVVAIICNKNLISQFINLIWTQGNAAHHKDFMDKYNRRYGKRPELHICF